MSEDIKDIESSEDVAAAMTGLERDDSFARAFKDKDGGRGRNSRFKKKVCKFCHNKDMVIDYKKSDILEKFLTERGKILPQKYSGLTAKNQRLLALEIKKARYMGLLPYTDRHAL